MNKIKKKLRISQKNIKHSFTGNRLTAYSGISPIHKHLRRSNLFKKFYKLFPTVVENANKFSDTQLLMLMIYASFCKINRLTKIETFSADPLIKSTLNLISPVNDSTLSGRFKAMAERGARKLEDFQLRENKQFLNSQPLSELTIDMDSTVSMVYGNQEGSAKGFNNKKKGAKSYHPLLAFITDYKLVMHTWFRPGNTYTSNGSKNFVRQILAYIPDNITKLFFRMDSGFFDNNLLDIIESQGHDYLVKVKFKGMYDLFRIQVWKKLPKEPLISTCEFPHTFGVFNEEGNLINMDRILKAIRIQTKSEKGSMGEDIVDYEYFCYCSNLENTDALDLHNLYKPRGESENWIEQVKNQLLAGKTLVDNFWANDIFWQLSVMAYNLSIRMRIKVKRWWQQEYNTFREWFVVIPGMLVRTGRELFLKIYKNYYYSSRWEKFDMILNE
jgi:hypothetical protein